MFNRILILLLLASISISIGKLIDRESFLSLYAYSTKIDEALLLAYSNEWKKAVDTFQAAYVISNTPQAIYHVYRCYKNLNDDNLSTEWYNKLINSISNNGISNELEESFARQLDDLMNEGLHLYYQNDYDGSINIYNKVLEAHKFHIDAMFHIGVSLQNLGRIEDASKMFKKCLKIDPFYVRARINLAALYHQYGSISIAIDQYNMALQSFIDIDDIRGQPVGDLVPLKPSKNWIMIMLNLAIAYMQNGQLQEAKSVVMKIIPPLEATYKNWNCPQVDFKRFIITNCDKSKETYAAAATTCESCIETREYLISTYSNLLLIQRSVVNWMNVEYITNILLRETLDQILLKEGVSNGPILPFDTMMLSVTLEERKKIAMASSSVLLSSKTNNIKPNAIVIPSNKMKIGFLSYDFNDHPTAHLVEAIFDITSDGRRQSHQCIDNNRNIYCNTDLIIFNYGFHDNSTYRMKLESLADKFYDIGLLSHEDASRAIENEGINILLDMQVHTLGNRMMILAHQPAPLQVNYLVYPGTSGASFLDHIVVDFIVAPPEHAQYYTESYLSLPPTYQISFYDRHIGSEDNLISLNHLKEQRTLMRRQYSITDDDSAVVICNFNKIDKIDQLSFTTWMRVLKRVPKSYLWLLEPSHKRGESDTYDAMQHNNIARNNLINNAISMGVSPSRIIFASRTAKSSHILRHRAGDLFLDTFVYGAHSTATDALRGGLPVLTLKGPDFPSRVAASLYASFDSKKQQMPLSEILVTSSVKAFEDSAVEILNNKEFMNKIKMKINSLIMNNIGLFNTRLHVDKFLHGLQALEEIKHDKKKHIIIL